MNTEMPLVQTQKEIAPENLIEFSVINLHGDTKHLWDRTKPVEVEAARELFKKLRKDGYLAYKVAADNGNKGEAMPEFDPAAGSVIFSPALQGG